MIPRRRLVGTGEAIGDLAFHILIALGDGAAHGYAIGKDVERRSGGRLNPATGALYQALKRLVDAGLVAQAQPREPSPDARRKYFELTPAGRAAAAREAERLADLVAAARRKKLYPSNA